MNDEFVFKEDFSESEEGFSDVYEFSERTETAADNESEVPEVGNSENDSSENEEFSEDNETEENESSSDSSGDLNENEVSIESSVFDYTDSFSRIENLLSLQILLIVGLILGFCFIKGYDK